VTVKLIKLRNGLELVSEVRLTDSEDLILVKPYILQNYSVPGAPGLYKSMTVCKDFLYNAEEDECLLKERDILSVLTPHKEVLNLYKDTLEDSKMILDENLETELDDDMNEFIDSLNSTISEINADFDEKIKNAENISITFNMNPKMFMAFLARGIVSMDESGEVDFDIESFMKNYEKFKGMDDDEDFNWNPKH